MTPRGKARCGLILLEVLVALTLLSLGAIAFVSLASESLDAVARAEAADRATARASAFLDAVALWPRADLDRHLGDRPEGPWRLRIARPAPTLYTVALTDSATGVVLLTTALYRAEAPDDAAR